MCASPAQSDVGMKSMHKRHFRNFAHIDKIALENRENIDGYADASVDDCRAQVA